jgi:hypothetical protein
MPIPDDNVLPFKEVRQRLTERAKVAIERHKVFPVTSVIEYGSALNEAKTYLANDHAFLDWMSRANLNKGNPWKDRIERAAAMQVAVIAAKVGVARFEDCPYSSPASILKWIRRATGEAAPPIQRTLRKAPSNTKAPQQDAAYAAYAEAMRTNTFPGREELAQQIGVSNGTMDIVMARWKLDQAHEAEIDSLVAKMPEAGRIRVEDATRLTKQRLEAEFDRKKHQWLREELAKADQAVRKHYADLRAEKTRLEFQLRSRGVFTKDEFNAILRCLHPDQHPSKEDRGEAFRLIHENKAKLLRS